MKYQISKDELTSRVEPGTYPARVFRVKDKQSANKNPMIVLIWKIEGDQPPAGLTVPENLTLIPESYFRLQEVIEACGIEDVIGDDGLDSKDLLEARCRIRVEYRDYEGKARLNVAEHLPLV